MRAGVAPADRSCLAEAVDETLVDHGGGDRADAADEEHGAVRAIAETHGGIGSDGIDDEHGERGRRGEVAEADDPGEDAQGGAVPYETDAVFDVGEQCRWFVGSFGSVSATERDQAERGEQPEQRGCGGSGDDRTADEEATDPGREVFRCSSLEDRQPTVGATKQASIHHGRQDRLRCGVVDNLRDTGQHGCREQHGKRARVGRQRDREGDGGRDSQPICGQHGHPPVPSVGHRPNRQRQHEPRHTARHLERPDYRRRSGELDRDQRERDAQHAVGEVRR
jgi:hypothetical protein